MNTKFKNKVIPFLLSGFILLGVIGLTGCGSDASNGSDPVSNPASDLVSDQSSTESSKPASTLESFFQEEGRMEEVKSAISGSMGDTLGVGGEIDLRVQGNELIYTFQFGPDVDLDVMASKKALDLALDAMGSVFIEVANTLQTTARLDEVLVTVTYTDAQGNVITTRTFQSDNNPA